MASRIWELLWLRASFCCAACSLLVRGTLARAFAAASASLRDGVGRPLPPTFAASFSTGVVSDLLRRNTERLRCWMGAGWVAGSGDGAVPRGFYPAPHPSPVLARGPRVRGLTR